jgi:hypothetical protein
VSGAAVIDSRNREDFRLVLPDHVVCDCRRQPGQDASDRFTLLRVPEKSLALDGGTEVLREFTGIGQSAS